MLLNQANIDVNKGRKSDGATPLYIASKQGNTQVVKFLLNHIEIDVNKEKKVTVFIGDIFVGSFTSTFPTRGHGGPMLFSTTKSVGSSRSSFRLYQIKGKTNYIIIIA